VLCCVAGCCHRCVDVGSLLCPLFKVSSIVHPIFESVSRLPCPDVVLLVCLCSMFSLFFVIALCFLPVCDFVLLCEIVVLVCCFVCYLLGLGLPLCLCLFFFVCPWCVLCESVVVAIHDAMHEIKRGLIECFFDVFEWSYCVCCRG